MRRFFLCYALIAAALPLVAGAAAAQTAPATQAAPVDDSAPADGHNGKLAQKFAAANTTHDGHLTLAQAQAAGLTPIATNFAAIDTANRGYVTFNQVKAWHLDQEAKQLEAQAAALRAQD